MGRDTSSITHTCGATAAVILVAIVHSTGVVPGRLADELLQGLHVAVRQALGQMRRMLLIVALIGSLSGCDVVSLLVAKPAEVPTPTPARSQATSPPPSGAAPTPSATKGG
ncbi:hypothetical protein [Streptosporangium amethystogenes]|uniref:hypothetical protein n=1 Tax=Streptosporangium amethystogenes TaxID=2002 RepID=UPI0012F7C034|nr:hypothetical protein [Streptosporangium amethystogenes]